MYKYEKFFYFVRLRFVTQNTSKTIYGLTDLHEVFKLQLKVCF